MIVLIVSALPFIRCRNAHVFEIDKTPGEHPRKQTDHSFCKGSKNPKEDQPIANQKKTYEMRTFYNTN